MINLSSFKKLSRSEMKTIYGGIVSEENEGEVCSGTCTTSHECEKNFKCLSCATAKSCVYDGWE